MFGSVWFYYKILDITSILHQCYTISTKYNLVTCIPTFVSDFCQLEFEQLHLNFTRHFILQHLQFLLFVLISVVTTWYRFPNNVQGKCELTYYKLINNNLLCLLVIRRYGNRTSMIVDFSNKTENKFLKENII